MIRVNLHGKLGEDIVSEWDLEVDSVAEALRAIEANTKKLRKWIVNYKDICTYQILVNKSSLFEENKVFNKTSDVLNSEFYLNIKDKIQVIDLIPVIEGSGAILQIIVGVIAVIAAVMLAVLSMGTLLLPAVALGVAGLGLIAGGTSTLLSKPPTLDLGSPPSAGGGGQDDPFVGVTPDPIGQGSAPGANSRGTVPYLFNGPNNTVGEGGPVPVGYGELIIGSNNVFASYDINYRAFITNYSATDRTSNVEGNSSYLFNSDGFLMNQTPSFNEPM
jgi:predicted phage tail protein